MAEVSTCLWFDPAREGGAEAAVAAYVAMVPGSAILARHRASPEAPVLLMDFTLGGAPFQALNGGPGVAHSWAASIVLVTADQPECDALWAAHLAAGSKASQCGWITDRWGISWQIFPKALLSLTLGADPAANARATAVMLTQSKIELAPIEAAARGN